MYFNLFGQQFKVGPLRRVDRGKT